MTQKTWGQGANDLLIEHKLDLNSLITISFSLSGEFKSMRSIFDIQDHPYSRKCNRPSPKPQADALTMAS